ncbi:MAG: hypothetical protein LBQ52_07970 [Helicobacteraceae bacterium]|jgi:hypothetical protein|nr:hypothetical protein [Helicobacteraceae bacterium]
MVNLGGNNIFEDNVFRRASWSADIYQTPRELRAALDKLNLIGKKIATIKTVGGAFEIGGCDVEDDIDKLQSADALNICVEIDEPFIIVFEDDERFEIDYSEASSVRAAKNAIPIDIKYGIYPNNFDAAKLFSRCIGETIDKIEILESKEPPYDYTRSFGIELNENQEAYINRVDIYLSGGVKFLFRNDFDYGLVTLTDIDDKPLEITLENLKSALCFS